MPDWLYEDISINDLQVANFVGFTYLITNLTSGRMYIGQKKFQAKRIRYRKNKRNRHFLVESDWRDYFGSNEELHKDVELLGKDNFKREIIRLCKTKGEMNYYETKQQFSVDALLNDNYYNSYIGCRITRNQLIPKKETPSEQV